MNPSARNDFLITLAFGLVTLWALWNRPLDLLVTLGYQAPTGGSIVLRLDGKAVVHQTIGGEGSENTLRARIPDLSDLPTDARLTLKFPPGSDLALTGLSLEISHSLLRGIHAVGTDAIKGLLGLQQVPAPAPGVGLRMKAESGHIDLRLGELPRSVRWKNETLFLWGLANLLVFGLLRLLRHLPQAHYPTLFIYGLFFCLFLLQARYYIETVPRGDPPDERAHVSYIAHLQESGRWYPDFERMPVYFWSGTPTEELNQLGHPPLYYALFIPFSDDSAPGVMHQWRSLRLINLGLAAAGLALLFWWAMQSQLPVHIQALYALALTSIPMLPYLAAGVNNDNLAIFSGALLLAGGLAALEHRPRAGWLLAFGLCLAPLAKLTVGVQAGLFLLLLLAALLREGETIGALWTRFRLPILLGALLPALYYGYTLTRYGKLLPIFGPLRNRPEPGTPALDFLPYLRHFGDYLLASWTSIVSHQEELPQPEWPTQAALMLLPLMALWGLFIPTKTFDPPVRRLFLVAKLGSLALLVFALIHLGKVYSTHLRTAHLGGIQARYYFPFAAALVVTALIPLYRWRNQAWTLLVGLLASANLLYTNLFVYLDSQS